MEEVARGCAAVVLVCTKVYFCRCSTSNLSGVLILEISRFKCTLSFWRGQSSCNYTGILWITNMMQYSVNWCNFREFFFRFVWISATPRPSFFITLVRSFHCLSLFRSLVLPSRTFSLVLLHALPSSASALSHSSQNNFLEDFSFIFENELVFVISFGDATHFHAHFPSPFTISFFVESVKWLCFL